MHHEVLETSIYLFRFCNVFPASWILAAFTFIFEGRLSFFTFMVVEFSSTMEPLRKVVYASRLLIIYTFFGFSAYMNCLVFDFKTSGSRQ